MQQYDLHGQHGNPLKLQLTKQHTYFQMQQQFVRE